MLLNQTQPSFVPTTTSTTTITSGTTLFKYIVKEKSKSVIVISSDEGSDDDDEVKVTSVVSPPAPIRIKKKQKRPMKKVVIQGNINDPISLSDSEEEDVQPTPPSQQNDLTDRIKTNFENAMTMTEQQSSIMDDLNKIEQLYHDSQPMEENIKMENATTTTETKQDTGKNLLLLPPAESSSSTAHDDLSSLSDMMELDSLSYQESELSLHLNNCARLYSPLSDYGVTSDCYSDAASLSSKHEDSMDLDPDYEQMKAPTTVDTYIPNNMDVTTLLRNIELYIQSVTEIPAIPNSVNETSTRTSRRTTRLGDNTNYYSKTSTPELNNTYEPINPYVPNRVWYNSTWEDWAQLDVGDILHCPFTEDEIRILQICVAKQSLKKSKFGRELVDFWQYVSTHLPGRSPLDCRCFWSDYMEGNRKLYTKPIIIGRQKDKLRNSSRHQLLTKRSRSGAMNYNSMRMIHLANMTRENIISEGSGDAITLAVFNDAVHGVRVAIGSLCDENSQYNMPGNLRLWDSDTNNCLSLKGHQTCNGETGQDIWRTVTDVKMSKDQSLIYSASHDGSANIWKASTGKLVSTLQFHCKPINQLAVNYAAEEINILATCSNDGTATIWTVGLNGKTGSGDICELDPEFYSDPRVDCIEFGHNNTQNLLFLGINNKDVDHPGYIEVFDTVTSQPYIKFDSMKGCVSTLAVSSSGQYIVSGNYNRYDNMSGDKYLHLHDSRQQPVISKFYSGHPDVNVVAISPCERYVASGNADKEKSEVLVFDVRNPKKVLHTLSHDQTLVNQSLIAPDSSIGIGGLYWMSDSRTILTGGGDSTVKVWSIEGATRLVRSYQTTNCVTSLTVHEDSMTIAAGVAGAQGIVHVWQP